MGLFSQCAQSVSCLTQRLDFLPATLRHRPPGAIPRAHCSTARSSPEMPLGACLTHPTVSCINGVWVIGMRSVPLRPSATTPAMGLLRSCTTSSSAETPSGFRFPMGALPHPKMPGTCLPVAGLRPLALRLPPASQSGTHSQDHLCHRQKRPARRPPVCAQLVGRSRPNRVRPGPPRRGLAGLDQSPLTFPRPFHKGNRGAQPAALLPQPGRHV